ncbi:DNA repair exonuclease SbcCD ATPase subunit [Mycetocola sp. CAN_C7]|uniref:hypothetical protein n=1 Tax=Mycetocola sp. CAN_C7 TaxID=2787724 RepID=UPI0018C92E9C
MDLGDVLVDLYLRTPSEFVSIRSERSRVARSEGETELAKQIGRLPKPSAAAWLINLLAARRETEIEQLIALGGEMREAEKDLDATDLRRLGKQRHALIRSIARLGNDLAADAGHRMSPAALAEVEQTLQAGMADADAADALRSGRLTRALRSNGIDAVDLEGAVAAPSAAVPRAKRPVLHPVEDAASVRRLAEATERSERALAAVAAAEEVRRDLRERRTAVSERRRTLRAERDDITARLSDLDRELVAVDREEDTLSRAATTAEREADVADRAAARAEKHLATLRDEH